MTLILSWHDWKFLESEPCFGHLTCRSLIWQQLAALCFLRSYLDLKPKNGSMGPNTSQALLLSPHRLITEACVRSSTSWVWAARRLLFRLWQWRSQGRTTPTGIFLQQATRWGLKIGSELSIGAAVLTLTNSDSVLLPVLPSSSQFASTLLCRHRLTFLFYLPVASLLHCGARIKLHTAFVLQDGHCVRWGDQRFFSHAHSFLKIFHCDCLRRPN